MRTLDGQQSGTARRRGAALKNAAYAAAGDLAWPTATVGGDGVATRYRPLIFLRAGGLSRLDVDAANGRQSATEHVMSDHTLKSAIDGAYSFQEEQQRLLDSGRITEDEWFTNLHTYLSAHYLAAGNPRGQSGHGGDEVRYRYTQEMVLSALHRSGTLIDIGCANGYLLEKLVEWASSRGVSLEVYGLDISAKMIQLARERLPMWTDRFHVGNALFWTPPRRFDFVCVRELNYVPRQRRRQFFEHLMLQCVSTGGRLILGPRTEERHSSGIEDEVTAWGYSPTGSVEKPHQEHDRLVRRLFWFSATPA